MAGKMIPEGLLTQEEVVERKLRSFIRKYYRIRVLQGIAVTLSAALLLAVILILAGNLFALTGTLRTLLLAVSLAALTAVGWWYVFLPLLQRFGLVKGLNFKEASRIIQQKHQPVQDRIINIIELAQEKKGRENRLYDFAIAQKAESISGFEFNDAIPLKKLGLLTLRLLLILAVAAGITLIRPQFVTTGIGKIWPAGSEIALLMNTRFEILNDSLVVESGKDFLLRFTVKSDAAVENVLVRIGSAVEPAKRVGEEYQFLFRAVNSGLVFRMEASGSASAAYELKTLKKPEISSFSMKVIPPGYTELESTMIDGDGNAEVPAGSTIVWTLRTVNTDELIWTDGSVEEKFQGDNRKWQITKLIQKNTDYSVITKNSNGLITNYYYKISVVRDLFPTVDIADSRDSTLSNEVYIQGIIQDDYGFSKLEVVENREGVETSREIKIKAAGIYEEFYHTIRPDSTNTFYFFRIWDNDRIGGPKFTDSRKISARTLTRSELENVNNQLADSIKSDVMEGMDAIEKMEKKISEFRMEQLVGDLKPWEIQEKMKELNQLKKEVVDFLNNISKNEKEFTENEELLKIDEELSEKAQQIRDLMENLMDEELKELMKQFEELAKDFNERKAEELTEKMEMNLEKLKEQMEMSLELFRKYEMERDLLRQAEKLDQMADSLERAAESGQGQEEEKLREEFKKWEEEFDKKLAENKELKKPMELDSMGAERQEVKEAAEKLEKSESKTQKMQSRQKASSALKKMARKMEKMMGMSDGEGQFVDLEDIRQIRNSLTDFSQRQEEINRRIDRINTVNPIFTSVIREQKELQDKFLVIQDSLRSMGYKQPVIAKMIGSELFHVETSMKNLFTGYQDNRADLVRIEQNKIMTEVNSIAMKLDELIQSMQNSKGQGKGDKGFTDRKKPKEGDDSGSEKMNQSRSQQQSMKEQLKSAIQKMKSGAQGKKERGEMARMLGEREMMRKALEQILQGGGLGKEAKDKANEALNMMKEVEKDIIYNRLGDHTLEKDNWITTKLLEAENAERERENENRRESKEFKGTFEPYRRDPVDGENATKEAGQVLKYKELKLKKFYQEKYERYIDTKKK